VFVNSPTVRASRNHCVHSRRKKKEPAGVAGSWKGEADIKIIMVEKEGGGWAQPLVFFIIRIPDLRLVSPRRIMATQLLLRYTANPVFFIP
jgi:hypothetical protein